MKVELAAREPEKHLCFVGFDKSHNTFFVYVANRKGTDTDGQETRNNHAIIYKGTTEREITTIEDVKEIVSPFAELPEEIEDQLLTYVCPVCRRD